MSKHTCAIVIPIYKVEPKQTEKSALKQVLTILGAHPIYFVCSRDFPINIYVDLCWEYGKRVSAKNFIRFKPCYFSSTSGYNKLLISNEFYRKFTSFGYILIYQLDAWVFKDELEYWCNKNYDYIGAPWFENWDKADEKSKFIGIGNGGFSLRKVSSHLKVLNSFSYIKSPLFCWSEFLKHKTLKSFVRFILNLTIRNNTFSLFNNYHSNEDGFWGLVATRNYSWFKTPDLLTASRFAFEKNASHLFNLIGDQLPFGCHKWEEFNTEFWKPHMAKKNQFLTN